MPQVTGGDGPSTKSVPPSGPPGGRRDPRRGSPEALLTTVSIFVENDCHERTTTSHIRGRAHRGRRPRVRHPHRLLVRQRRRGRHRHVRRRRVVLSDGLPRRADRRRTRPRHQSHPARPGAARPGDQRPADRAARGVRRGPLPQGSPALRRRGDRPVPHRHEDRRVRADHAGGTRHRGRPRRGARGRTRRRARPRPRARGRRPPHLARPGEVRRGRRGRRQGLPEGRPGPRRRLPRQHRDPGQGPQGARREVPHRPRGPQDRRLRHHPRRLRLPRRALRADRGGHQRPRPRHRAQRGTREGPPEDREGGRRHHRLLRDPGERQDRQDPRR